MRRIRKHGIVRDRGISTSRQSARSGDIPVPGTEPQKARPLGTRPGGQRSGDIPVPGTESKRGLESPRSVPPALSAKGAPYTSLGQRPRLSMHPFREPCRGAPFRADGTGLQPSGNDSNRDLGRWPRLVWFRAVGPRNHRRPDPFAREELVVRSVDPAIGHAECVSYRNCGGNRNYGKRAGSRPPRSSIPSNAQTSWDRPRRTTERGHSCPRHRIQAWTGKSTLRSSRLQRQRRAQYQPGPTAQLCRGALFRADGTGLQPSWNQLNRQPGPLAQAGMIPGRWPSWHKRPGTNAQTSWNRPRRTTERGHSCPRHRTTEGQTSWDTPRRTTERGHSCPRHRTTEGQTSWDRSRRTTERGHSCPRHRIQKWTGKSTLRSSPQRAAEKDSIESDTMAARRRLRSFSGLPIDSMASRSPSGTGPKRRLRASRTA